MPRLPVLHWPDPRLSTRCAPVAEGEDMARLAADMLETMYAAPGRGLAAPQVGVMKRLFVMDTGWKDGAPYPRVLVNPELVSASGGQAAGPEGCLSLPGTVVQVTRAQQVRLRWRELSGALREEDLAGFAAVCAQHEMDHLDGIMVLDRLDPAARAQALADRAG